MRITSTLQRVLLLLIALSTAGRAQAQTLSDLTLGNFFSEGWNQDWTHRPNPDGAPDISLLRVQTNYLERELRMDSYAESDVASPKNQGIDFFDGLIAYGLNRRLMISVASNYEWIDARSGPDSSGSSIAGTLRFQLIDVPGSSLALNLRVQSPNDGINDDRTIFSYALAGWKDLTPWGLDKVGLYFHVQPEIYAGPQAAGAKRNDVTYDLSLAKTWTEPGAEFGNFTTFVEMYCVTDLDGSTRDKTVVTATPAIRTSLPRHQAAMLGVDLPVSHPRPFGATLRLTYIVNF